VELEKCKKCGAEAEFVYSAGLGIVRCKNIFCFNFSSGFADTVVKRWNDEQKEREQEEN